MVVTYNGVTNKKFKFICILLVRINRSVISVQVLFLYMYFKVYIRVQKHFLLFYAFDEHQRRFG